MTFVGAAGVMGWPVAHSKSPTIHRFWLDALGLDGDYSRFAVAPEGLGEAVRALPALGLRGVNVTVPHKVAVMAWLDDVDEEARIIGAVNTVLFGTDGRSFGLNTDDVGFVDPLRHLSRTIRTAVLIGAGGAARAVLAALKDMLVEQVIIVNRNESRALELIMDGNWPISQFFPLDSDLVLPTADLVINATSLGMKGQPSLHVSLRDQQKHCIVYDLVYQPLLTDLLSQAQKRGLRTVDGLGMLIGQAAAAFTFFYGHPPPRELDGELRARLMA